MHRTLTNGLALTTLSLGFSMTAFAESQGQGRPSMSAENQQILGGADQAPKHRGSVKIAQLATRPSLQDDESARSAPQDNHLTSVRKISKFELAPRKAKKSGPEFGDNGQGRDNVDFPTAERLASQPELSSSDRDEIELPNDADLPDWTSCDPFDVNADGKVDFEDLAQLLASFGTAEGDLTGNGEVDGEDLGLLLIRISNHPRD